MPFDQYGAWMLDRSPWDPAPAPGNLAPYDAGAPPSVQGGAFDLPPWGVHDVPDLAGAVQAGADSVAASQAIQPEQLPERTPQEDADKIQIEQPPEIAFTPEEAAAIARGEPYDANQIQIEQPAVTGAPVSAPVTGRKVAAQPAPYSAPPWANPMLIKLAEVRDEIANTPPGPDRDALAADLEAQTAWMTAHGIPVPPSGDEGIVIEQPGEPTDQIGAPEEHDGPPFSVGGGDITPGHLFNAPVGHAASDAEVLDFGSGKSRDVRDSADAYANATPEHQAEMDARESALFATKRQTMELAQAQADQKALEDNIRIAKQAREKAAADMAQLQADVQGMADSSPIESWWADRSTMGKLAGIVGAIFSGLANPQGPNGAIEMMMKTADQDAAQKWKKIEARRQMLGEQRAANEDDATARERIRLASREQAIRMIETQMNGLDPQGTQAINLGKTIAGLRAQDAQALEAYRAGQEKRELDIAAAESQRMQAQAQMLNAQSLAYQRGYGRGAGAGAGVGRTTGADGEPSTYGLKDVHSGAKWAARYSLPAGMKPPDGMNGKEFDTWFDKQKALSNISIEDARHADVKQSQELALNAVQIQGPGDKPAVNADGKPALARDSAEAKEAGDKLYAARQIISMIDQINAIREESSSYSRNDWVNSDAAQKLKTLGAALKVMTKNGTQGMSSDEDMKSLAASVGASDVQSFRDRSAGLALGRERTLEALNGYYRDRLRYNGPAFTHKDFPNNYRAQPVDPKIRDLAAKPESKQPILSRDLGINDAIDRATPDTPGASEVVGAAKTVMRATPGVGMLFGGSPAGLAGEVAGYVGNKLSSSNTESKRNAAVDELRTQAVAGGPNGEIAVRTLGRVAHSDAADTAGRQAAMHALLDLIAAGGEPAALARAALTEGR